MKILINNEEEVIDNTSITITELLKIKNVEMPETVSVQLNGEFLSKEMFSTQTVKEGDEVDFLYFMGGGSL